MDSAMSAVRGVGPTVHSSLPRRARFRMLGTVVAGSALLTVVALPAASPAAGAPPARIGQGTVAPEGRPSTPIGTAGTTPTSLSLSGSDQVDALQRDIRRGQAQLDAVATQVTTLTARRDTLATDLAAAKDRAARASKDLAAARKDAAASTPARNAARAAHDTATAAQKSARTRYDNAQATMSRTQARLDELAAAWEKAASGVQRSAAAAEKAKPGTREWKDSFPAWQMAAVAGRAAHARMVLIEDRAADSFVDLQGAQAALTKADHEQAQASKALAEAEATRASAAGRAAALVEERSAARTALADLTRDLTAVTKDLARATALSEKLTARLAGLKKRLAALEGNLAGGRSVGHSGTTWSVVPAFGGVSGRGTAPAMAAVLPAKAGAEKWRESGAVVRVLDGDTFDMTSDADGRIIRVRITGIQAPESRWCGGKQARKALAAVLPKGTQVRLASIKEKSGNAPTGVWRVKRTAHVKVGQEWVDIAPPLLAKGLVFPFPFIGEDAHNDEYLALAWKASQAGLGLYDSGACGASRVTADNLRLEVVADGPGPASADAEFVLVFNGSGKDLDLSRWMVQDTSPLNAFFFPKGARIRADDYVVVFSGSGTHGVAPDGTKDERYFYAGTGMRWNNNTADIAFLFDSAGKDKTGNLRSWLILTPES